MDYTDIRAMLHYPDADLVRFALDRVNLSVEEWTIIKEREFDGLTIEQAAETLYTSVDTVKRRYKAAMDKLLRCWSATPWIKCIVRS